MESTDCENDAINGETSKLNSGSLKRRYSKKLIGVGAVFACTIFFVICIWYYLLIDGPGCLRKSAIITEHDHGGTLKGNRNVTYRMKRAAANVKEVCRTEGCVWTARNLLLSMDSQTNPCDDFYKFACGGFLKNNLLSSREASISIFTKLNKMAEERINVLIEEPVLKTDPEPYVKMKTFFKACINTKRIAELGLKPLKNHVSKMGGWPLSLGSKWDEQNFDLVKWVSKVRSLGYYPDSLFQVAVLPDFKNNSNLQIYLFPPVLISCKDKDCLYRHSLEYPQLYEKLIHDVAIVMGAGSASLTSDIRSMIDFEKKINAITSLEEVRPKRKLFYLLRVEDLQVTAPFIPWTPYLNSLIVPDIPVANNDTIISTIPEYLANLQLLMENTPKRVLANFLMWRLILDGLQYLQREVPMFSDFSNKFAQNSRLFSRKAECTVLTKNIFNIIVGSLYVKRHFSPENKAEVKKIVEDVRYKLMHATNQNKWMDKTTKYMAMEKIKNVEDFIAYPNELINASVLTGLYSDLIVNENEYYRSLLNVSKFHQDYLGRKYHKSFSRSYWISHATPTIVNAFYYPTTNTIDFPAALIQSPLFSSDRPSYINYGMIGFIIAHEISHAMYEPGRDFDKYGNYRPWWDRYTKEHFESRAKCLINQYQAFVDPETETQLNSNASLAENFADNSGAELAYAAYKMWKGQMGKTERGQLLPGLEKYSRDQLFWISFASAWCSKEHWQYRRFLMTQAEHAPARFRITGALSNQESFARAFHCNAKSRMNPPSKCKMW